MSKKKQPKTAVKPMYNIHDRLHAKRNTPMKGGLRFSILEGFIRPCAEMMNMNVTSVYRILKTPKGRAIAPYAQRTHDSVLNFACGFFRCKREDLIN